jgi:hypothetical protein
MPALRKYKVFISHAWHRSEHYQTLVDWFDDAPHFDWTNLSVPEHEPVSNATLEYELRNQMRPADVFVILSGMYAAHSEVIDFELKFARMIGSPIIGVRPWGSQMIPAAIQRAATEMVGWNSGSIVRAIRAHARASG